MLDHFPTPQEIYGAQQNFDMGCATNDDIQILQLAHPYRQYTQTDPISDFFSLFDW